MKASVVTCRDPFRPANHRSVDIVRRRRSLRALAPRTQLPVVCQVNGQWMPRRAWSRRVADGDLVVFVTLPQGGGGGSNPLRAVLMIAVMVFAPGIAGAINSSLGLGLATDSFGMLALRGAVGLVGSALVNALVPAAKASTASTAASLASASPTYSLSAQGNQARIGQPIPVMYGRHLIYPDFAAQPYTEYAGNDQYLYELFCIGQGYYDIESIRIDDSNIYDFPEVTTQIVQPGEAVTLFPSNVVTSTEVSGQEAIPDTLLGPFVVNAAGTAIDRIAVDLVFPRGLYCAQDSGALVETGITWTVQVQRIDDNGFALDGWVEVGNHYYGAATTTPIRLSISYGVGLGRYRVRLQRTGVKETDSRFGQEIDWVGLRGYIPGSQVYGDVTMLAVRMRATNSLSAAASRKVNLIATRKLPVWNGSAWSAPVATRSIAWALADICRAEYGGKQPDARIDLAGLLALDAVWAARGDTFNFVFDSQSTVGEALTIAARAGRAIWYKQGGIVHFVRDQPAMLPVALFTPRNIVRSSLSIDYLMTSEETADAIDVTYFDETVWTERTVRAALPGSAQTVVAAMKLPGVTSRAQAWKEGMYAVACNRYRRRFPSWSTEMEGFIPTIGDLVALSHDMPQWGQSGEIVAWDAATKTATLSEPLTWTSGVQHMLAWRGRDGSVIGPYYAKAGTDAYHVVLTDWSLGGAKWSDGVTYKVTPDTSGDRERSHFAFGPATTQYIRARLLSVKPRSSETVELAAVIESDYVHTADTGAVPSDTAWHLPTKITKPVITSLSARSLPGNALLVVLSWPPAAGADHYYVEQSSGDGHWTCVGDVGATSISTQALYGAGTVFRVAPVGITQGAWVQASYADMFSGVWNAGPQNFAAVVSKTGVMLTWDPVLHLDVTGYRIFDQSGAKVGDVSASFLPLGYVAAGAHTWTIRAINTRGALSPNAGSASVTVSAPDAPGVASAFSGPNLVLTWTEPAADQAIDRYKIKVGGTTWATASDLSETYSTTFTDRADWSGSKSFWIAAIDKGGNISAPVLVSAVVTIPAQPAVTVQIIDNNVLLYWSDATRTLPIEAYEIRRGSTWDAATRIGTKQGLFTVLFESVGGVFTYWIAGVDSAGNVGIPAAITATVNEPPDYLIKSDYYSTFSGAGVTFSNAAYEESTVLLPVNTTETVSEHFDTRSWTSPDSQIAAGYPIYIQPAPASGYYEQVIDYGTVLASNKITVTPTIKTIAGSPVVSCRIGTSADGTTYTDIDNVTQLYASNFRYARVRITVTGGLCRMTDLNVLLDSKLHTLTGSQDVSATDAGGTTVRLTDDKTASGALLFVDVDSIQVTPRGTTPCYAIFDIDDAPYPPFFKVFLFDMAGARIAGTVDYMVRGF